MLLAVLRRTRWVKRPGITGILSLTIVALSLPSPASAQVASPGQRGRTVTGLEKVRTIDLKKAAKDKKSGTGINDVLLREGVLPPPPETTPGQRYSISIVDRVAVLRDRRDGTAVRNFSPPADLLKQGAEAKIAVVSPDDKWAAVYFFLWRYSEAQKSLQVYKSLEVYDTATGSQVRRWDEDVYRGIKFSPDSTLLAYTAKTDGGKLTERPVAIIRQVGSWNCRLVIDPPPSYKGISSLAISPDNTTIALGGNKKFGLFPLAANTTQSCEPQKIEPVREDVHPDPGMRAASILKYDVSDITFSTDGTKLFTVGEDGTLKEWKVK